MQAPAPRIGLWLLRLLSLDTLLQHGGGFRFAGLQRSRRGCGVSIGTYLLPSVMMRRSPTHAGPLAAVECKIDRPQACYVMLD